MQSLGLFGLIDFVSCLFVYFMNGEIIFKSLAKNSLGAQGVPVGYSAYTDFDFWNLQEVLIGIHPSRYNFGRGPDLRFCGSAVFQYEGSKIGSNEKLKFFKQAIFLKYTSKLTTEKIFITIRPQLREPQDSIWNRIREKSPAHPKIVFFCEKRPFQGGYPPKNVLFLHFRLLLNF